MASITFSLLLVAVQQSASWFTAQAFDQFLRRRLNQFYMGFFVRLGGSLLLQAATVQDKFVPVYGTALAVLLSVIAVGLLLVLVSSINQMRPVVIVEAIHDPPVEAESLAVVTADSQQHQVATDLLEAFTGLFGVLPAPLEERTRQLGRRGRGPAQSSRADRRSGHAGRASLTHGGQRQSAPRRL